MSDNTSNSVSVKHPIPAVIKYISQICILGYILLVILFFFLTGDQLHFRSSHGNMKMPIAQSGTVELYAGNCVDQHFVTEIQRLEKINIQWGTYYRPNAGTVIVELHNLGTQQILMSASYDAATITEGQITTMTAEMPLENVAGQPLMIRIYSPDGQSGSSVSPLMSVEQSQENLELYFSGLESAVVGTLCFSAEGTDYIWIGLHYWELVTAGLLVLLSVLIYTRKKVEKGKESYILCAIMAIQKYRFLIRQLISRDFKTKYKRSVLGMFWSFLNPLLTMLVQYVIFSTLFKNDIPYYAAYLVIGVVCFNFFTEVCNFALFSILGNAALITKVYMPKYIYPMTRVMSSVVNLAIAMVPMLIVCLLTGVHLHKSVFLALYFLVCLVIFCMGMAFFLCSLMVFFRDIEFIWGVLSMVWMYATALFYPASIIPEKFRFVLDFNPIYQFIKNIRICILDGISPEPKAYLICIAFSCVMLLVGAVIFKKSQDKFILYL